MFAEARNILDASAAPDAVRALFIFGSILSPNTPSRVISSVRALNLGSCPKITPAEIGEFWRQPTLHSFMAQSRKSQNQESTSHYLLKNISTVFPPLREAERLNFTLQLVAHAVELNLPLCDINLLNLSCSDHGESVDEILSHHSLPPWLRAVTKSANFPSLPLPPIVSDRDNISKCLSEYLGLESDEELNAHFVKCGMIRPGQSVSDTIRADLEALNGVDLELLVRRFESCVRVAWASHIRQVLLERDQDPDVALKIHPEYREYNEDILRLFSADSADEDWRDTNRSIICGILVSGDHHRDPFHPFVDTFNLASDWVRGSSDIIIINTMISTEFSGSADQETLENLLAERYNSRFSADWESDPGVIYCSDMSPYLFHMSFLLQGSGCRYRIDPVKLCWVLGLEANTPTNI
jgi:hypothetical protein